jgi:hypothetical protein
MQTLNELVERHKKRIDFMVQLRDKISREKRMENDENDSEAPAISYASLNENERLALRAIRKNGC